MNTYDLSGRVAVVTGGAQGIGLAVARRLALSGARVAIWDMDLTRARACAAEIGGQAWQVDVSDTDAVAALAQDMAQSMGPVGILVTSAGIAGSNGKVVEYSPVEWRQILDVNLTGTFNCCRAVLPQMQAQGCSMVTRGRAFWSAYSAPM